MVPFLYMLYLLCMLGMPYMLYMLCMLCMLRMCGVYAACAVHAVYGTLFGVFFVYHRRETIELSIELELEEILLPGGKTTSRPPRGCGRRLRTPRVELGVAEGARGRFCRQGRAGSLFHRQGRHSGEVHRMGGAGLQRCPNSVAESTRTLRPRPAICGAAANYKSPCDKPLPHPPT